MDLSYLTAQIPAIDHHHISHHFPIHQLHYPFFIFLKFETNKKLLKKLLELENSRS